jgi:hypothetical protein
MNDASLWHIADGTPSRLAESSVDYEKQLERWIESEPRLVAHGIEVVQNQLNLGGVYLDLWCVEDPGTWIIIELKRHKASREALLQAIDYAARMSELTIDNLEREAKKRWSIMTPSCKELVEKALDRERAGEGRDIRIILAGVGTNEDLIRMVRYMEGFSMPVSVCSFSAYESPTGQGIILSRATQESDESKEAESTSSSSYDERLAVVRSHAESMGQRDAMEQAIESFSSNDRLFVRPYKRGIMIAPDRAKNRYLAYFAPRTNGIMAHFGIEPIQEFFPGVNVDAFRRIPAEQVLSSSSAVRDWATIINSAVAAAPRPNDE